MHRAWIRWFRRVAGWFRRAPERDATAADDQEPRGADRRRAPRQELSLPVVVRRPGRAAVQASVAHLSPAGCLLHAETPLRIGNEVSLAFRVPRHGLCGASGQVVRMTGDDAFAVQFSQTNQALRELLDRLHRGTLERRQAVLRDLSAITIEIRTR
jgi:hypothetical protein